MGGDRVHDTKPAEVLNWLNKWTSRRGGKFYGVKVTVTKTGDSFDDPSFRKVVWPGGWSKDPHTAVGTAAQTRARQQFS